MLSRLASSRPSLFLSPSSFPSSFLSVSLPSVHHLPLNSVSSRSVVTTLQRAVKQTLFPPSRCNLRSWRRFNKSSFFETSRRILPGVVFVGGFTFTLPLQVTRAKCKTNDRRVGSVSPSPADPPFDWDLFFQFLRPQLFFVVAAILAAILVAALNVYIPRLLGDFVDVLVKSGVFGNNSSNNAAVDAGAAGDAASVPSSNSVSAFLAAIKGPATSLVSAYLAQGFFTFGYITFLSFAGENVANEMRKSLFASLLEQDIAFFDGHKTGELLSRLTTDVQDFKSSFKSCVSQGFRSMAQSLGCLISLYTISPTLTTLMGTLIPGIVLIGWGIGTGLRKLSKMAQHQVGKSSSVAEEALGNVRTVRAFAAEDRESDLFDAETDEATRLNKKLGAAIGLFQGLSNVALNGIVLGVLAAGGCLMADSSLKPGDLMSFLVASQTIQRSLAQLSMLFGQVVRGMGSGSRVFEFIRQQPSIPTRGEENDVVKELGDVKGDVKFTDVTFAYPTRPEQTVLRDFSLDLPAGRVVALVGESGGGKSTVASLLERFYDVDAGVVTLDGVDLKDYDPAWLRGTVVAIIDQEPTLFATSVRENIRYGCPSATDDEVEAAARKANAHDFVQGFPEGYETVVGQRGVTVSGGQKQRIAIARALLKNPRVLILDEATSALDSASEQVVQSALDAAVAGRTVLVIAHRLSTIKNADSIAVIRRGKVAELGDFEGLMRKGGIFAELMRQQQFREKREGG